MASSVMNLGSRRSERLQALLVGLGCVVLATLIGRFYGRAVLRYTHFDAAHYRHYWAARWWLVAHLGGGSLGLLLGPFQFSAWRRKYVKAHRWIGRLYLGGVVVGSIAAVYMGLRVSRDKAFGVALLYLALPGW